MSKPPRNPLARALPLAATLALAGSAAFAAPQAKPPQSRPANAPSRPAIPGKPGLVDRVLAVIDEDPILESDVDRVVKLGLQKPNPGEAPEAFRKRILNLVIDERVRIHEVDRFGFTEVPVEAVEGEVARIEKSFPDPKAFQKALAETGLTLQALRQRVTQQLLVLTYVDERLGSGIMISNDEIAKYYRAVLTPAMQKQGTPPPPLEDVRDQIREAIKQQKLTGEMTKWTEGLRSKADIVIHNADGTTQALPPVVKKITAPPKKG